MAGEKILEVTIAIPLGNADVTTRAMQQTCHEVEALVRQTYPDARYDWHELRNPKAAA